MVYVYGAGNEEKIKKGILDLLDGKIPYGRKPSLIATVNSLDCKIIGENIIRVEITQQISAVPGKGKYEISIMSITENRSITSFPFFIKISACSE